MLTDKAIQARKDYFRKWRQSHKQNIVEHQERYWNKKAEEADHQQETEENGESENKL